MDLGAPLDLMTLLYDKYAEQLKDVQTENSVEEFVKFARDYLAKQNQPINVSYLPVGIGLRLQQGQIVGFAAEQFNTQMRDEGIHITRPTTVPGMHGISDMSGIPIMGSR